MLFSTSFVSILFLTESCHQRDFDLKMQTAASIARQTIALALERFGDGNKLEGDFPWSKESVDRLVDDDTEFDELKANLRIIEAVEEQLQQMLASASEASRKLREAFVTRANRDAFRNLPDEILAIILEMALGDSKSPWITNGFAGNFSLVSRHFHKVVLSMPVFWSKITSPPFRVAKATLFASRAVSPTISFSIKGVSVHGDSTEASELVRVLGMYQLAVSVSARIQRLALHFRASDWPHFKQILGACEHVSLPSLSEFKLTSPNGDLGSRIASICRNWEMPSLQKLLLRDVLPELPNSTLPQIKTLFLEANRNCSPAHMLQAEADYWATDEISEFLISLVSVEHLRIALQIVDGLEPYEDSPVMESVKTLDLRLQNTEAASSPCILHFIDFPSIESFKVELGMKDFEDLNAVLDNLQFITPPTSVTNVTVGIGREYDDSESASPVYIIGDWCERFGDVKSFKLESKRDNAHGLFAFASPFDALDVVDEEGSVMSGSAVEGVPFADAWRRPRRKVVFDTEDKVTFVDEDLSDTDSDFDF
ncbi:hypothetical protein SCHPADRAFT_530142 [Schizopora paradoxa]|uniref:F-box domain-containing protein n=1 Tax=Schizopora paradoxa TaxID=27342 RepID=A0A0H2REG2_9AGAM|nr:hypothetical protein SCHPADRAFT_530142 [Schizopora paradoxa]